MATAAAAEEVEDFFWAVKFGDEAAAQEGLAKGLVNEKGEGPHTDDEPLEGWSALHWAAEVEELEMVKLLLAGGANVEAADELCWTPLHVAVVKQNAEIVQMLLAAGADPRVKIRYGSRELEEALAHGNQELAALLRGAEEEWTRPFVLQVSAACSELTCRTMSGRVVATVTWPSDHPVQELPVAVLEAMRGSGFEATFQPLQVSNLRLVLPNGQVLDTSQGAAPLEEQLAFK